ncbi:MAG: helix-turn-helix transcriptional regulator [Clostridiales bacterium]|nr:helix-turn-helix transcriptional regulator [Clostridiales bacterium]
MSRMDYIVNDEGAKIMIENQQADIKKNVGQMINRIRLSERLTQVELAKRACIDRANLARLENGNYNPTLDLLVKIAEATGKEIVISFNEKES